MSKLSDEEEKLARAALEENDMLRKMLQDSTLSGQVHKKSRKSSLETADSIFSLRRGNDILKGEIVDLQTQLEGCGVSAAQTFHKFIWLREKRANLRNETRGLRNIMTHQIPKVQEANRVLAEQLAMRKLSEEKNRAAKEEIKRLKETREKEMGQFYAALRREAHLKEQLESAYFLSQNGDRQALRAAIVSKEKTIRNLEEDVERARITKGNSQVNNNRNNADDAIAKLRAEYESLSERLQLLAQ